jgi:protein O-GlcNAc transferase
LVRHDSSGQRPASGAAKQENDSPSTQTPPGTDAFHTEKLLRLPDCAWCWRPDPDGPEATGLPAARAGRVTFGCLNRLAKLTPRMAGLWARVLAAAAPGSRLVALVPEAAELGPSPRDVLEAALRPAGVAPDRVVLLGRRPRAAYMRLFQDIDLALDSFPYAGHTTTCDATTSKARADFCSARFQRSTPRKRGR